MRTQKQLSTLCCWCDEPATHDLELRLVVQERPDGIEYKVIDRDPACAKHGRSWSDGWPWPGEDRYTVAVEREQASA